MCLALFVFAGVIGAIAEASPRSWPAMLRQIEAETADIDVAAMRLIETARLSAEMGRPRAMSALRSDVDALNGEIEELSLRLADLERIPLPAL